MNYVKHDSLALRECWDQVRETETVKSCRFSIVFTCLFISIAGRLTGIQAELARLFKFDHHVDAAAIEKIRLLLFCVNSASLTQEYISDSVTIMDADYG